MWSSKVLSNDLLYCDSHHSLLTVILVISDKWIEIVIVTIIELIVIVIRRFLSLES